LCMVYSSVILVLIAFDNITELDERSCGLGEE
jgi:hypothetical protein